MSRRRYSNKTEPARCKCEGGSDRAAQHGKPGAKAADHGDPFFRDHRPGCIHSELQRTTKPTPKKRTCRRLRLEVLPESQESTKGEISESDHWPRIVLESEMLGDEAAPFQSNGPLDLAAYRNGSLYDDEPRDEIEDVARRDVELLLSVLSPGERQTIESMFAALGEVDRVNLEELARKLRKTSGQVKTEIRRAKAKFLKRKAIGG